jgi:fatty acid desaturase
MPRPEPSDPTSDSSRLKGRPRFEWQTALLCVAVYGNWVLAVASSAILPAFLATAWMAVSACWFMSLQHELIHGHPTRYKAINRLLGLAPLAVWYPYDLYRASHLAHHRDELLTEPGIDPESNYIDAADYERLPAWVKPLWVAQRTALGRFLIGPAFVIVSTGLDIVRKPWQGNFRETGIWVQHAALVALLLWGLDRYAGISPLVYVLGVGYPALGLAMLRSFHEHRPATLPAHRVVVNEAGFAWRLLFLNNNYHSVHHEDSSMPWYRIRSTYLADREGVLKRNGGFLVPGYNGLIRQFAIRPTDSPVHPSKPAAEAAR